MTRFTVRQYAVTTYEFDLALPASIQARIDAGENLDSLPDDERIDLYEAFTAMFATGTETDYEAQDTVIVHTDLPGHTPVLPITI